VLCLFENKLFVVFTNTVHDKRLAGGPPLAGSSPNYPTQLSVAAPVSGQQFSFPAEINNHGAGVLMAPTPHGLPDEWAQRGPLVPPSISLGHLQRALGAVESQLPSGHALPARPSHALVAPTLLQHQGNGTPGTAWHDQPLGLRAVSADAGACPRLPTAELLQPRDYYGQVQQQGLGGLQLLHQAVVTTARPPLQQILAQQQGSGQQQQQSVVAECGARHVPVVTTGARQLQVAPVVVPAVPQVPSTSAGDVDLLALYAATMSRK
jgi:hypothetical protein